MLRGVASSGSSSLVPGTTVITGGTDGRILYDNNGVLGEATGIVVAAGAVTTIAGTTITATTQLVGPTGLTATNGITLGTTGTGFHQGGNSNQWTFASGGVDSLNLGQAQLSLASNGFIDWRSASNSFAGAYDVTLNRAGQPNSLVFAGATQGAGSVTSRTEINKAVTGIADATPTATFTVTIPNAAHSACLKVILTGSLGAGGAIGANEATASIEYNIAITRTSGVNATATISSAYGSAATAVAGAATVTVTGAVSAISGSTSAANTFTVNVTITKSGGASASHTCLVYGKLMNANASGITIA